ncbi:MAG: glycosyl hydrolase family 65 protein [Lyngbya sp.]|nr:glycosyl hydrolase family 65 protein [Lyngbya sp.]
MMPEKISDWELTYTDWNSQQQPLREALCALGNGYIVTRGAFEEVNAGGCHYPGTYLAGGYNRVETEIAGHIIENEALVNWPNWLPLTFRCQGGDWLNLDTVDILEFSYRLDIYRGVLERKMRFRFGDEREFSLISRRFVHMERPHLAAIEWRLTAHNWSGEIEIRSALDGSVTNQGVERYRKLNGNHLETLDRGLDGEDATFLTVRTNQSQIQMAQADKIHVFEEGQPISTTRERHLENDRTVQHLTVSCQSQKELRIEKIVAIHTSRDFAISQPTLDACKAVRRADSFDELLRSHERKWRHLWSLADISLHNGNSHTQFILRFHIFHLLQTTSTNTIDRDVGVPSRGWHGEAYRGHILWDELFIFPFLTLRIPELTRSLLMYRYRRLLEARYLAQQAGYDGAMFPWQSGSNGREESQDLHLNPRSGRWIPDNSNIQRHVNAAIAYNVWQYYQATHDREFLAYYGAELLLDIARFWASIVIYNGDRDRYEIRGVMGPDEFHTGYPDTEVPGLNNNAYTNVMAAWVLRCAVNVLDFVGKQRGQELREILEIDDEELQRWDKISRRMFVPFHDNDIISQFEGYEKLKEFDWAGYREKYDDIQRLDRILEAEDDDINRYQASKQADVLMLFYLFSSDALQELFEHMGYRFDRDLIPNNINYYKSRTSHGSTLSRIVHSWVLARCDRKTAWELFEQALHSDIGDIQGGTTPEGIHLGAMAGTVDLVQRCYMGLEMRDDVLWFDPLLPHELSDIELQLRYRGHWLWLRLTDEKLLVSCERGCPHPVKLGFRQQVYELGADETREFSC